MSQCLGRFVGIIGHNPRVSKSNRLHVVIFWVLPSWIWGTFHRFLWNDWYFSWSFELQSLLFLKLSIDSSVTGGRSSPVIEMSSLFFFFPLLVLMQLANVVPVGPLLPPHAIHNRAAARDSDEATRESKGSMKTIGKWLDAQPPRSVVYISFGSIFSPTVDQIKELAQGLEASGQRFVWVVRHPDHPHIVVSKEMRAEELDNLLPPGTKSFPFLTNAPFSQPRIGVQCNAMRHERILTHSKIWT